MSLKLEKIFEKEKRYVLQTYSRYPICLKKGKGVYVWDIDDKKYIDFLSGISVCLLGYNHKEINKVINKSYKKLIHTSNLFYLEPQIRLAEKLSKLTNKGKVFFSNSGAEANEAALKLARAYGNSFKKPRRKIVTLLNSFHGRTLNALFATGQKKYQKGFEPKIKSFQYIEPNNVKMLRKVLKKDVAAFLIELVQGEGGINVLDYDYVQTACRLCKKYNIIFMVDEIQTGLGRTGRLFAYQSYDILPDVITLAKGLANGLPIGVTIISNKYAEFLKYGMHASTFGGGYLVSSVAEKVIQIISDPEFLHKVRLIAKYFEKRLIELKNKYEVVNDVRGRGLMRGLELKIECKNIVKRLLDLGLITNCVQNNILRFLPPLIIEKKHVDEAIDKIDAILKGV